MCVYEYVCTRNCDRVREGERGKEWRKKDRAEMGRAAANGRVGERAREREGESIRNCGSRKAQEHETVA